MATLHEMAHKRAFDRIRDEQFDLAECHPEPHIHELPKLGLAGAFKPRLQLADYLDLAKATMQPPVALAPAALPAGFSWGMLLNDQLGDCVPAEMIHSVECFHINAGTPPPPFADVDASTLYHYVAGYINGDPSSDQGTDPGVAWRYWKSHGIACKADKSVHKILGLVGINYKSETERHIGMFEFSAVQYAIQLPVTWQGKPRWTGVPKASNPNSQPGSWGGHGVAGRAYDAKGNELIMTWGEDLVAAANSLSAYLVEAAVVVSSEMADAQGMTRCGVAIGDLVSDLAKIPAEPIE